MMTGNNLKGINNYWWHSALCWTAKCALSMNVVGCMSGSVVDFGPAADAAEAFKAQAAMNDPGMSPPFCSEF